MKKLKLEIDALRVESFDTVKKKAGARGTVRGHLDESSCGEVCTCATCPDENTFVPFVVAADPLFAAGIVSTDDPMGCTDGDYTCGGYC